MLLGAVAGCSQDASVANVNGTVCLDGNPLTAGTVQFVPAAGRAAKGTIQSDGTFRLGTYSESDGALVGPHRVAIIAYEDAGYSRPAYEVRGQTSKALVPERYLAIGTSGLTFDVKPGHNQADIELSTKPVSK